MVLGVSLSFSVWAQAPSAAQVEFNIPRQPLSSALAVFARQAGMQVLHRDGDESLMRIFSDEVHETLPAEEALRRLLVKSGLTYEFVNPRTVRLASEGKAREAETSRVGEENSALRMVKGVGNQTDQPEEPADLRSESRSEEAGRSPLSRKGGDSEGVLQEVVVTGTSIHGAAPTSPLTVITIEDIARSGYQTAGEIIRSLPESFTGGQNVNVGLFAGGPQNVSSASRASTANLRGLGSDSTLTLVNGYRLAGTDAGTAADISSIPLAAIDRVEVVTDGASAIYGSDAVAGVVNFILKKSYNGLATSLDFGGATDGGALMQKYSVTAGRDWGGGGAVLSYEFMRQNAVYSEDRDYVADSLVGTSLLPSTRRNSLFLTANQALNERVELFAQGLYTRRSSHSDYNYSPYVDGLLLFQKADVRQYGVVGGASMKFAADWHWSITANSAGTKNVDPQLQQLGGVRSAATGQFLENKTRSFESKLDGTLFNLPAGAVGAALGAGYRNESYFSMYIPGDTNQISANRNVRFIYGEAQVPLVRSDATRAGFSSLTLSIAGRYEEYSDVGSSANPKVGLLYRPMSDLKLRASWGTSFKAPTLLQEANPSQAYLMFAPDPNSTTEQAIVLLRFGGNPQLNPEKSSATTFEAEYTPAWWQGASMRLTYFNIRYKDRIEFPITNTASPLTDPFAAPFLTYLPSEETLAEVIASSQQFNNFTGLPYDPAAVTAIADDRYVNAAKQRASGFDVFFKYGVELARQQLDFSLNTTFLNLTQRVVSLSPEETLSGTVFYPPHVRLRGGATWQRGAWSASGFVNYVGDSEDPSALVPISIASWTTFDAQSNYALGGGTLLDGTRIALSVQNLFNREPPRINSTQSGLPGVNYDATNASALGRFINLQLSKAW
jgi:outer membrane receptor protein involved in Fe transport